MNGWLFYACVSVSVTLVSIHVPVGHGPWGTKVGRWTALSVTITQSPVPFRYLSSRGGTLVHLSLRYLFPRRRFCLLGTLLGFVALFRCSFPRVCGVFYEVNLYLPLRDFNIFPCGEGVPLGSAGARLVAHFNTYLCVGDVDGLSFQYLLLCGRRPGGVMGGTDGISILASVWEALCFQADQK